MAAVSDLSFDVPTALHSKQEALEVNDTSLDDDLRLFKEVRRGDGRHTEHLRDELKRLVREGRFR